MPRTPFNRWNHRFIILCSFFIGFFIGLNYWNFIVHYDCSSVMPFTSVKPTTEKSMLFYDHFKYRTVQTCQNHTSKIFLTIAVLSSHERLNEYLPAIFETWFLTATIEIEIIIFLEEQYSGSDDFIEKLFFQSDRHVQSCLFIVKLKHVENEYPPQKKSFYAMQFLYAFYQHRTSWILRLDDNAFVNIPDLLKWLKSIDHQRSLYIGQGGTGRKSESTIYFPPGKYFCMGGSGVILSQQTLIQIGPWLDRCFKFELRTIHEDVELGRCILAHVNIDCTNAYNSKYLFYHHYGHSYSFGYDFTPAIISSALILHPIRNRTIFQQIYKFFKRKQQYKFNLHKLKPSNKENYVTFVNSVEFDLVRDTHYQSIDARWKAYIDTSVQSYLDKLKQIWHRQNSNWTIVNGNVLLGYHRFIPQYGLELIVEVLLNIRTHSIYPSRTSAVRKRFHIRQPFIDKQYFEYREIDQRNSNNDENKLNIIVVAKNKDQVLLRFIRNFQDEILNDSNLNKDYSLTILYFYQKTSLDNHIKNLTVRYSSSIRLIIINGSQHIYNRGFGRQLASTYFSDNQLLFFLDVDIKFTKQSLINTRDIMRHQLSLSPCAVYFPIIFSLFSTKFSAKTSSIVNINKDVGLFSIYGFGNVAVRKQDLDRIGGWEIDNYYWGSEDVNLFRRFVNLTAECYIFRSVEPGFRHFYHKKMCNDVKDPIRLQMCYDAENILFGPQGKMVDHIFNNGILNV